MLDRETMRWLLVRMVGELNLNKKNMLNYLKGEMDFEGVDEDTFQTFKNYIDSNLPRLEIVRIMAGSRDRDQVVKEIKEVWKKNYGDSKVKEIRK